MSIGSALINADDLRQWIGRERIVQAALSPFPAQALAAALDRAEVPKAGDPLPPAWHWLYFLETPQASATGHDGHPKLGGFLPPVPLPRRMWAAARFDIVAPLVLGHTATRKTVIQSVETKTGRTGTLVFVTLNHELSQLGQLCIREEQNLVYREMPVAAVPLPPGEAAPLNADISRAVRPDPVLLFRYSALTYNGHRIHYDRPYAIEQEFYPGLVVHGPLLATLLLDLLREKWPEFNLVNYSFRVQRPAFDTMPFTLNGRREGDVVTLWITDHEGQLCLSSTATHSS